YGIDLVTGVAQVAEYSQATRCREWVASFTDSRCGYYAHQNGSDFIQWETAPIPSGTGAKDVVFVFSMGTGYGSPLPQPSGQFDLLLNNTEPLISFRVTKESLTWRKGDVAFHYWVKRLQAAPPNVVLCLDSHIQQESMASYGIGFLKIPKSRLKEGQRAILRVAPKNRQTSKRWFKLDVDTWARLILKADLDDGLAAVCAPAQHPMASEFHVFFGDLHAHSGDGIGGLGKGCGTGTMDENYLYARDVAPLDFCAIAEHDWQMADQADWQRRIEKADEYNSDGRFVTLPSFERTSLAYGHRNVYYAESKWPFFSSGPKNAIVAGQCDTPADLWRKLREAKARAITGAH
ncbi:MAG: DUF3604 domain-containing protein, partial [Planctomycetes bacterium]|nr:DUF3604 domain-containing protein [Planctomycetota bacterium]